MNVALDDISFADSTVAAILPTRMNVVKTVTGAGANDTPEKAYFDAIKGISAPTSSNTTLFFNDGSAFSFLTGDSGCTQASTEENGNKLCPGFIDVNGAKGPNKTVTCDGKTVDQYNASISDCTVTSPTDIYPVVYYDQTIIPSTDAARAVLYGK